MLGGLRSGLREAVNRIVKSGGVDKDTVKELKKDIQRSLILSDVDHMLTKAVTDRMEERALEETPPPGLSRKDHVVTILYEELSSLLGEEAQLPMNSDGTTRILLLGIQGSGKTTTCSKLAKLLSGKGLNVGVIGADNYRPGALAQLRTMCEKSKTEVYGSESRAESDEIVAAGMRHFGDSRDAIIIDTAGRHKEEGELLDEMRRIGRVARPHVSLLVIDGTIGQQCRAQAEAFHKSVPVGGIVVTKLDSSANGGGALAAAAATGARVMFVSNGERVDDLVPFSPTRFVGNMLGMGDVRAVLDLAKKLEGQMDDERAARIYRGKMTLLDFLNELMTLHNSGSMRDMLESIPGMAGKISEQGVSQAEENIEKWRSMVQSMTEEEQRKPEMLNRSRILRISRGSGCTSRDVRILLKQFNNTKNIIKSNKGHKMQSLMRRMGMG